MKTSELKKKLELEYEIEQSQTRDVNDFIEKYRELEEKYNLFSENEDNEVEEKDSSKNNSPKKNDNSKKDKNLLRIVLDWIFSFLIAIVIIYAISFIYFPGQVSGESMMATYHDGEKVLIQRRFYGLNKKDVVVFWADKTDSGMEPDNNSSLTGLENVLFNFNTNSNKELHIKRIVGTPGDKVQIKNDNVLVNGKLVLTSTEEYADKVYELGKDQYFVLGDNGNNSLDSREHGPISTKDLYGKVVLVSKEKEALKETI